MMPMTGQVFDDPSSKWYSLQDRTEPPEDESVINSKGDVIVVLKYVPSEASPKHSKKKKGTLMIFIKEAKKTFQFLKEQPFLIRTVNAICYQVSQAEGSKRQASAGGLPAQDGSRPSAGTTSP